MRKKRVDNSPEGKNCIRCSKFWGPKTQNYLCSYCFEGHIPSTESEKNLFQKNFKKNMEYELKTYQTFNKKEFDVFLKNCKVETAEELFQLLIGLKEYPRIMLNSKQSNDLYFQLIERINGLSDDQKFIDFITLMFCYEPFEVKRNTLTKRYFNEFKETFESKDHLMELLKSWKYKHQKLS